MPTFSMAARISKLPPYLFAEIDRMKAQVRARGVDLISFGIGDPDLATPPHVIDALAQAARDPTNHRYPDYEGLPQFRAAVAQWYQTRFGVSLDPDTEVLSLIGGKEGIANLPLAFVDPGDIVIVPEPGYPVYNSGTLFAGGTPFFLPLRPDNGFLLDYESIPADIAHKAKILWFNYPNNPTGAIAPGSFYQGLITWAQKYNVILAADNTYSEIAYGGYRAPSFLEFPGARETGVEFHSLSKTYSMTGWRCGFVCGHPSVIAGLGKIKTNVDSGIFKAIQYAGIAALTGPQDCVHAFCRTYESRRDALVSGLRELGYDVRPPQATFYVWMPLPKGVASRDFTKRMLNEAGVVTTPGVGFGPSGEGYVRFAVTVGEERIREALARMRKVTF